MARAELAADILPYFTFFSTDKKPADCILYFIFNQTKLHRKTYEMDKRQKLFFTNQSNI
jgi:hypothetical protein